ncbi:MAG TPA: hypothetical protein VG797_02515 [Phycisphaerales bacterium]|nr:hypothetical protein [Phycisphaerales bacterium]
MLHRFGLAALSLVLAAPALASVVYVPALPHDGTGGDALIDLNADGVNDLAIAINDEGLRCNPLNFGFSGACILGPDPSPEAPAVDWAAEFRTGDLIGTPGQVAVPEAFIAIDELSNWFGPQCVPECNNCVNFLGAAFQIGDQTHYGWVRLRVEHCYYTYYPPGDPGATARGLEGEGVIIWEVQDYAYESDPGVPIAVGAIPARCLPGDADRNGRVGLSDIAALIGQWFRFVAPGAYADLNADGMIGLGDVAQVIGNWGEICD